MSISCETAEHQKNCTSQKGALMAINRIQFYTCTRVWVCAGVAQPAVSEPYALLDLEYCVGGRQLHPSRFQRGLRLILCYGPYITMYRVQPQAGLTHHLSIQGITADGGSGSGNNVIFPSTAKDPHY